MLPVDRTNLTAAASNQIPNQLLASALNIAAIRTATDGVDEVYNFATGLVSASTLSRLGIINVKDYNASGLDTTAIGSITTGTKILTLTTTPDFVAGMGINLRGVFEVASLEVGAAATVSSNVTVTLNGVAFTVAVLNGDTAIQVATKIRAATYTGWTAGGTAGTTTVTFTSNTTGTKTDASYSAGTTGSTATFTTTVQGTADQITTVSSVSGLVVNIADNSTRTISGGTILHNDNAAFTSAALVASRGVLFIPITSGKYNLTDEISIPANTKVRGEGYASWIKQNAREKNVFIAAGDNVVFEGVHLEGDGLTTGLDFAKNNGIYASGVKGLNVRFCTIEKSESSGIQLRNCYNFAIHDNRLQKNQQGAMSTASDITVYSGTNGGRGRIQNNHCLSNNSQGIAVNVLGFDTDILIQGNIIIACDDSLDEMASASVVRRHGVLVSYNGNASDAVNRISVQGNFIRMTNWSGVYVTSPTTYAGLFLISGNFISNFAHANDGETSILGGLLVIGGGIGDVYSNNVIYDSPKDGMKISYSNTTTAKALITGNTIRKCVRYGILINNSAGNLDIASNQFLENGTQIRIANTALNTNGGNVNIKNNRMAGNTADEAMYFDIAASTNPVRVEGNDIKGSGNVATTYGIYSRTPYCVVLNNKISSVYRAFYVEDFITGRNFNNNLRCDFNEFKDVTNGITIRATTTAAVIVVEGNVFESVTNKIGSGGAQGAAYLGRRIGDKMEVYAYVGVELTAAPTVGTFIAGDRWANSAPAAGGRPGGFCTTGGNPGTWKSMAAIDA